MSEKTTELNSILEKINEKLNEEEFEKLSSDYAQTKLKEALESKSFDTYTEEIVCNSLLQQYQEVEGITWDNEKREEILDLLIERSGGRGILIGSEYYLNTLTSHEEILTDAVKKAMSEVDSSNDEEYNIQRFVDVHLEVIEQVNEVALPENIKENIASIIKKQIEQVRDNMIKEQLLKLLK